MVEQQQNKPFWGKPYLKYGQCHALWSYFFQLGGILAAKHATNLDAFGSAFLGASGKPGAVENFFTDVAARIMMNFEIGSMKFWDYVSAEFIGRVGYSGNPTDYFLQHGMDKIPIETASELAWQYAEQGAALGAIYPQMVRTMFERTHATVLNEKWEAARAAGLDIPREQELTTYEETEQADDAVFMAYCRDCCPRVYTDLSP